MTHGSVEVHVQGRAKICLGKLSTGKYSPGGKFANFEIPALDGAVAARIRLNYVKSKIRTSLFVTPNSQSKQTRRVTRKQESDTLFFAVNTWNREAELEVEAKRWLDASQCSQYERNRSLALGAPYSYNQLARGRNQAI